MENAYFIVCVVPCQNDNRLFWNAIVDDQEPLGCGKSIVQPANHHDRRWFRPGCAKRSTEKREDADALGLAGSMTAVDRRRKKLPNGWDRPAAARIREAIRRPNS